MTRRIFWVILILNKFINSIAFPKFSTKKSINMFGDFCSISCWAIIPLSYVIYRITRTFVAFLQAILIYYIAPIFYAPNFDKIKYRWTVVSGGTDGIGKAYMFELARRGVRKFLIIGRNEEKMEKVKNEMESMYPGSRVVSINFDFNKAIETESADKLRKQLEKIDIGLAVNSVGVGREFLERFGDRPEVDRQIFRVNAFGAAEFISAILPSMERNGGGQFVVISSSQGFRPIPLLAAYSATKSFISFISEAVDREYAKFNIRVQCLTPALVATNMTYYKNSSLFVVSPEKFAYEAVGTLGLIRMTTGCFNHEIQMLLRHLFPWTILKHLIMPIYWHHQKRMIRLHGANESSIKLNNNDEMSEKYSRNSAPNSPKHSKIPTFCGSGTGIRHRA